MITIVCGVVNIAAMLLVRKVDTTSQNYEPIEFTDFPEDPARVHKEHEQSDLLKDQSRREARNTKPWLTCKFHTLCWIFVFAACIMHALIVSFSTYSDSLGFAEDTTWIISMIPTLGGITTFLGGLISDYCLEKVPRMSVTLVIHFFVLGQLILSIFHIDKLWVLILLALSTSMTQLSISALIPSELHKLVGDKYYGTSFGILYFTQAILTLVFQYVASLFYDMELRHQQLEGATSAVCQGKVCFTSGFILYSAVYSLCVALNIFYVCKN